MEPVGKLQAKVVHDMKAYVRTEVHLHFLLISTLYGSHCSTPRTVRFNPVKKKKKNSCNEEIEGWVVPRRDNFLAHALML